MERTCLRDRGRRADSSREWVEQLEARTLLSASLVRDINTGTAEIASAPGQIVNVDGTAFFVVDGHVWKSDGTAGGTVQVTPPGILGGAGNLTAVDRTLYFTAGSGWGQELWKTDGTREGTGPVADVNPGPGGSNPRQLTNVGGTLYFVADTPDAGAELWWTDDTESGAVMIADLRPGPAGSDPRSLCAIESRLYFVADDGTHGYELWRSEWWSRDATLVRDVYAGPGTSGLASLTNVNGTLFFSANPGFGGYELWRSDGAPEGTQRVKDVNPGREGSSPALLTNVNGTLYFSAYDGQTGDELWRSDGTGAGTVRVRDLTPGPAGSGLESLTAAGDRLFFRLYTPSTGSELWVRDGSSGGTAMVRDLNPGWPGFYPREMTAIGGTLYFWGTDPARGYELWKSDGTAAGTTIVTDLAPGGGSSSPSSLAAVGSHLYFTAYPDGFPTLFRTDGTPGGTVAVTQINRRSYPLGSNPSAAVTFNGAVYFAADDGVNGPELWRTDGSTGGTALFKDLVPGPGGSSPSQFLTAGGRLYFAAAGQLWRTDGTVSGTAPVPGTPPSVYSFSVWGDGVAFLANDAATGEELWRARPSGPAVRLTDVNPGPAHSRISAITPAGDSVYFVANDGATGDELWKSNGAPGGATRVRDIIPGPRSSGPWFLAPVGNSLLFRASDGTAGWELWRTDGTGAGTTLVKDIFPGPANSDIGSITSVNGTAYFTATDGVHGIELWTSDGTAAGTVIVRDIHPGRHGSSPAHLTAFNGALYFRADDGAGGQELWRSDGTTDGTAVLRELRPGAAASVPHAFTPLPGSGRLMFRANAGGGYGLWVTDGTAAGTEHLFPTTPWLVPPAVAYLDGAVYFGADLSDGSAAELWKAPPGGQAALAIDPGAPATPPPALSPPPAPPLPRPRFVPPTAFPGAATGSVRAEQPAPAPLEGSSAPLAAASPAAGPANLHSPIPDLLDTLWYAGRPDLSGFGMVPAGLHYFFGMYPGDYPYPDQDAPDEATVRSFIRSYGPNYPVVIPDVEQWPIDVRGYSDGLVQVYLERFEQIVDWMHDEVPGIKVGFWSILPLADYWTPVAGAGGIEHWRAANDRLRPLADKVDVIFPSLYATYDDRVGYSVFAEANMREAARFGKPVSPFVWPQYFEFTQDIGAQDVPADYWRSILKVARGAGNPITLWGGYRPWDDDAAWWAVTRDFALSTVGSRMPPPTAPAVIQAAARNGPPHRVTFSFNTDVSTSLLPSALTVRPILSAEPVPATDVSYDPATQTATFTLPASLASGEYEAVLSAAGVTDASGTPLASGITLYFTAEPPPVVVTVNDGSAGRSAVPSLTLSFSEPVALQPGAVVLTARGGAGAGTVLAINSPAGDQQTYLVTFTGPQVLGGSLGDGVYDLTIAGARVTRIFNPASTLAADFALTFHRLYGDVDGDGDADNADLFQMRSTYGKRSPDPLYNRAFDYDDDGDVDNADMLQVRSRRATEYKGY